MSKNLDQTVRLQSEKKRKIHTRGKSKEIAEGAGSALPVWPDYQPRRSPGETSVRGPTVA